MISPFYCVYESLRHSSFNIFRSSCSPSFIYIIKDNGDDAILDGELILFGDKIITQDVEVRYMKIVIYRSRVVEIVVVLLIAALLIASILVAQ